MEVRASTAGPLELDSDTVVVGLFEGKGIPHDVEEGALTALVEAGEAKAGPPQARAHARGGQALDRGGLWRARRVRRRARPDRGGHRAGARARARRALA